MPAKYMALIIFTTLIPLIAWLVFIYWYREKKIRDQIISSFRHEATLLSETILTPKICEFQNIGEITCFTQPLDDISVFLYRDFCMSGTRHKFYLGLELINWNIKRKVDEGVYGSGYAIDRYTDPYIYKKPAFSLSRLKEKPAIPIGYSAIEIRNDNLIAFYKINDFLGYEPISLVKEWINSRTQEYHMEIPN